MKETITKLQIKFQKQQLELEWLKRRVNQPVNQLENTQFGTYFGT